MRVRALMTVEIGTALKPRSVPPGGEFDIDKSDPENLIGRGIVEKSADADAQYFKGPTDAEKAEAAALEKRQATDTEIARRKSLNLPPLTAEELKTGNWTQLV